jgi:hypothetical protein
MRLLEMRASGGSVRGSRGGVVEEVFEMMTLVFPNLELLLHMPSLSVYVYLCSAVRRLRRGRQCGGG